MNRPLQYRIAIIIYFFVNGFVYANCTGRLPELKDFFGVSNSVLGTMLFMTAIGALVAMPLTGWLTTRYNSGKLTICSGLLFCCIIPFIPISSNIWIGRISFLMTGFFSGAMDITMNGQAVFVERAYKKTIMSSFHAAYSIGMALGAASGALFASFHFPLFHQLLLVATAGFIALAIVAPVILRNQSATTKQQTGKGPRQKIPFLIWLIAIIGFCGMTGEGSMVDWSAIYMHTVVGRTKAFSALAVGSFATAMTIGRLFGDRLIDALGKKTILFCSCFAAITGLAIVLLFVNAPAVLIGLFLVGAGLSNVVPVTYSTAGNIKGIEPAAGIAIASTIGYSGFFVGPPAIGYLSDSFGLRIGLCFTMLLFLVMLSVFRFITRRVGFLVFCFIILSGASFAQPIKISNDPRNKKIDFNNKKIRISFDYDHKATISSLIINEQKVIDDPAGIYSEIKVNGATYSTLHLSSNPSVQTGADSISITGIVYGNTAFTISENWTFHLADSTIRFDITRTLSAPVTVERAALPVFVFHDTSTWDGAYQDYGGLAWFYLFNKRLDTYGIHSYSSEFWNSSTGNGLNVSVEAPGHQVVMDYSRSADDKLVYSIGFSPKEMLPHYDSGTQRRRFIRDGSDVWAPYKMEAGTTTQQVTLAWFDFNKKYYRGDLVGVNGKQVSAVLNTIARIGVIDKQHFGGNSWHTPYGPICLHEQYIAQLGLAINDSSYLKGYRECLDFYRDNAIKPDGRVWPRWAYSNEDMMPGEVTEKGFYEAQWGYLLDANPDLVANVAELYDQTGDLPWVATHKLSCEKALDWILKRDGNNNGLVEMITDSHQQKKGSDWLDIIWASYENAFVNAKLYHALVLWAAIEKQLGDTPKAASYRYYAEKLKTTFNRSTAEGGFWDPEKKCYIHWRDKDGSIHGNNMVTPVNFMAIAYGICDDNTRKATILDNIETQMQKEQLFFWPVCMYSYNPGEGNDWQFPFPKYENGDLFLSWGSIAVKAYAAYKPELAVKYVNNVLAQYAKDGLAFQRYGRLKQDGLGDDILSGNSLSVVGLYQAIYGINPLYNRFYLDPHITPALSGTRLSYNFRGQKLSIGLDINRYSVSNDQYKVTAVTSFGFYSTNRTLSYFNGCTDRTSLKLTTPPGIRLTLDINTWTPGKIDWTQSAQTRLPNISYRLNDLEPDASYVISINGKPFKKLKADSIGTLVFSYQPRSHQTPAPHNYRFFIEPQGPTQ